MYGPGFVKFVQGEDFRASQELAVQSQVDKLEQKLLGEVLARSRVGPVGSHDYSLSRGFAFLDRRRAKRLTLGKSFPQVSCCACVP
jgi:hypothetical protein